MERKKLDDTAVNVMLAELAAHFGEPVLPVSRYCKALRTWGELAEKRGIISREAHCSVQVGIEKSNLLGRLIYGGEKLRTRQCPVHLGEWRGIENPGMPCPQGCGMTGWLPEPSEAE